MRNLLVGVAAVLFAAGIAMAHHTAANDRLVGHHTAADDVLVGHHTVSDVTLAGGTAAAEAEGHEIERGPHGGALVPLGDGVAALEFTFDVTTGMFEMHVWDATLESRIGIRQNMAFLKVPLGDGRDGGVMLIPLENEITGDRKGDCATFIGGLRTLIGREEFEVLLEWVMVDEQSFRLVPFSMPDGNGLGPGFPAVVETPDGE